MTNQEQEFARNTYSPLALRCKVYLSANSRPWLVTYANLWNLILPKLRLGQNFANMIFGLVYLSSITSYQGSSRLRDAVYICISLEHKSGQIFTSAVPEIWNWFPGKTCLRKTCPGETLSEMALSHTSIGKVFSGKTCPRKTCPRKNIPEMPVYRRNSFLCIFGRGSDVPWSLNPCVRGRDVQKCLDLWGRDVRLCLWKVNFILQTSPVWLVSIAPGQYHSIILSLFTNSEDVQMFMYICIFEGQTTSKCVDLLSFW